MHRSLGCGNHQLALSDIFNKPRPAVLCHYVSNDDPEILLRRWMILVDFVFDTGSFSSINAAVLNGNVKTKPESELVLHVEALHVALGNVEELLRALKLRLLHCRIVTQLLKSLRPHVQDSHFAAAKGDAVGKANLI